MTLYEYINNITANGTRVILPRKLGIEQKTTLGEPGNMICKTMWVQEETRGTKRKKYDTFSDNMKKHEVILAQVTSAALNCIDSEQFYRKCFAYAPPDAKNGAYEKEKWDMLLLDLACEISCRLSDVAYIERNSKGARIALDILQSRINAWQKRAVMRLNKSGEDGEEVATFAVSINVN